MAGGDEPAPDALAEERLGILRALEQGELDVAAAMDRLAELDDREGGVGEHGPGRSGDG